ncbi:hypothetical protein K2173_025495 [Erythroxylum novogranatense]|uniref:Pentatricopeptide repeat-containing protein n=1 Tax=Erythroxylum novogranatense TaxID=1862640 RepID=A0AAV8UF83_9ROSI|nr:hypothetical protein K2173_025495 [Erythroxylum novogranatense]
MRSKRPTILCFNLISRVSSSLLAHHYSTLSISIPHERATTSHASNKFVVHCNTQITQHGRNGNLEESESIFNRMPHKTIVSYTAMLTAYALNGQLGKAQKLFDQMPERNTASYNAMITAYVRHNCMVREAYSLFSQMDEKNEVSYAAMITGFLRAGLFDNAESLYHETPVNWRDPVCSNAMISGYLNAGRLEDAVNIFGSMKYRDVVSWSSMIDGYCKKGKIAEARVLFNLMHDKNVVTWTAMISGYMKAGSFADGFSMFLSMRKERAVAINPTNLTVMFEACGNFGRYREGMQLHGLALRIGSQIDILLGNSIISMYGRCGFLNEATRVFQRMRDKDMVSWNLLISGYVQQGEIEKAHRIFVKMPEKDVVSWTTILLGYSRKGDTGSSIQLFRMMPEKDDVAWTALISGFVSNGDYEKAIHCYIEMRQKAVRPNSHTFSSMLSASAVLANPNHGSQIHAHIVKMGMEFDLFIQNSLVSMYSKCGNIYESWRVFLNISAPNVISFNSMITGLSQNGSGEEALQLFGKMQNESIEPNEITFLGVLAACVHLGLVQKGREYFNSMRSLYGIEPGPDHYSCMVDLLGRAGLVDEANNLIQRMPVEPHLGVWGALLSASRIHHRLDLAKLAAHNIIELEPDSAIPYVVLSDLYNIAGRNQDGDRLRMRKHSKRIKKSPGCSWIMMSIQK